jgi:hypothetical protein
MQTRFDEYVEGHRENKTEAHRDRPVVTLSKRNGDAGMTVRDDTQALAAAGLLADHIELEACDARDDANPVQSREGMEDGDFEN